MINEEGRLWEEVALTRFKAERLLLHSPERIGENKKSVSIGSLRAEIWTRDLPNVKQYC